MSYYLSGPTDYIKLDFVDITSKIRTIAAFVIPNLQWVPHAEYAAVFIILKIFFLSPLTTRHACLQVHVVNIFLLLVVLNYKAWLWGCFQRWYQEFGKCINLWRFEIEGTRRIAISLTYFSFLKKETGLHFSNTLVLNLYLGTALTSYSDHGELVTYCSM
jgi:hypothetical protein